MGGYLQLAWPLIGFIFYILDLASDVYVALQFYKNGQSAYFMAAFFKIIFPFIIFNIFATRNLRNKYGIVKGILCLTHFSAMYLFIEELYRHWEERKHSHNGNHFSKCDCLDCKKRFKKSTKHNLEHTVVRYMETFAEAAPQFCLQVMVRRDNGGPYPWYAIASILLSFLSILWSIYCLEKAYWINRRVEQNLKPATFPKSSAIVFLLWQTLLLLARCFTIVILPNFLAIIYLVFFHYAAIVSVMQLHFRGLKCGGCAIRISSLVTSFPWHFHVSTSGLEAPSCYFHGEDGVAVLRKFVKTALVFIPVLFMLEVSFVIWYLKHYWLGLGVCGAILTGTVVSLFYYKCCHPAARDAQVGVERTINVVPINDEYSRVFRCQYGSQ